MNHYPNGYSYPNGIHPNISRRNRRFPRLPLILTLIAVLTLQPAASIVRATGGYGASFSGDRQSPAFDGTWIVKWASPAGMPDAMALETDVVQRLEATPNAAVIRPKRGIPADEWQRRWQSDTAVAYLTPNQIVRSHAKPSDPYVSFQEYLGLIGAEAAWELNVDLTPVKVAIVDTGIDYDHPELKDAVDEGINLVQPGKPAKDDNGHGTNVAGIIAAVRNNKGIAGLANHVRLLPVKALDRTGNGKEAQLGEGIRYAVEQGAKVIVLSVGLMKDDPFIREAVEYAESRDCVLVAATGNEEGPYVNYPAAYPTVLAVGGIKLDGSVEPRSNYGPEVDLVAPWNVYTTKPGGRYEYKDGTSMAAPQVAAAAALVRGRQPGLKAYEVRSLLKQTAQDIADPGWDERTGYGIVRIDRALTEPVLRDPAEPNNNRLSASPFPVHSFVSGEWMPGDEDWFWFEAPESGMLDIKLHAISGEEKLAVTGFLGPNDSQEGPYHLSSVQPVLTLSVPKGRSYLRVTGGNRHLLYRISSELRMAPDEFESNNRPYTAYTLPERSQVLTGTFHTADDQDWFLFQPSKRGSLRVQIAPSSKRMDPILTLIQPNKTPKDIDEGGLGKPEVLPAIEVSPGVAYYIGVRNYDPFAPVGTYKLQVDYVPAANDPHEPNDKSYQATAISFGAAYEGIIDETEDEDWFAFHVEHDSLLDIAVTGGGNDQTYKLALFDSNVNERDQTSGAGGGTGIQWTARVNQPGTYYLRITSDRKNLFRSYNLTVNQTKLVEGFLDIDGHWAEKQMVSSVRSGWMTGYDGYAFKPDRYITRAEIAASLGRALKLSAGGDAVAFADVPAEHWAYGAIQALAARGWLQGYADGTFAPERPVTRAEMAVLVGRVLRIPVKNIGPASSPFKDVPVGHWAQPMLRQMYAGGWIDGYDNGTFRPNDNATRAEWAVMLTGMFKRG
ncbi:peptidase S8 [Paenibacillus thermoaerophilus]|nr:peptidase S8 [Paenibacillus thermoaerophilus]